MSATIAAMPQIQESIKQQPFVQNDLRTPHWDVFISHAADDADAARKIAQSIRAKGLSVWLDAEHDLPKPRGADAIIRDALRNSRLIVPIISFSTKPTGWLSREWGAILGRSWEKPEISILPVLLDDIDPPNFLRDWHYIISGHDMAKLKEAADMIVCYMASPESVVDDLKIKPADPREWEERFDKLRKFVQELKELETAGVA